MGDEVRAPFGWRFAGVGGVACGMLGILLFIYSREFADLIWGIFFLALGSIALFAPFYEKKKS